MVCNMECNNKITLSLFVCLCVCILGVILFYTIQFIYNLLIQKLHEQFDNKRTMKMKIYKSDEILDPDENPSLDDAELDDTNLKLNLD